MGVRTAGTGTADAAGRRLTRSAMPVAPKAKITSSPKKNGTATTAKFKFKAEPSAGADDRADHQRHALAGLVRGP